MHSRGLRRDALPPVSGHYNMIEKAETDDFGCGGEGARGKHISFAGSWIS